MFIPHYGCAYKKIISYFSLLLFIFLIYVEWEGREERREGLEKERKERESMRKEGGRKRVMGRKIILLCFHVPPTLTPKYPPAQTCVPTLTSLHLFFLILIGG